MSIQAKKRETRSITALEICSVLSAFAERLPIANLYTCAYMCVLKP